MSSAFFIIKRFSFHTCDCPSFYKAGDTEGIATNPSDGMDFMGSAVKRPLLPFDKQYEVFCWRNIPTRSAQVQPLKSLCFSLSRTLTLGEGRMK